MIQRKEPSSSSENESAVPPSTGIRLLYIIGAGLLLLDLLPFAHHATDFYTPPGFYGFYGFAACVLLVLVAKQLRKLTKRREDYYD